MIGKVCLVTGATSGIGKATACALAQMGAVVILVGRNEARGRQSAEELRAKTGNKTIDLMLADLSSQKQIHGLAESFNSKYQRLDVLINNAGAMFPRRRESDDGIEMTLAVNHLAPFLLTNLLLDKLRATGEARIINVNSDAHAKGRIDFTDLQMHRCYPRGIGMRAYANAKLANLLTVYELARRLQGSGVTVNALHPGYVATNILPFEEASGSVRLLKPLWAIAKQVILSAQQGAGTPVFLASSPLVATVSGQYFEGNVAVVSSPASRHPALQRQMWDVSRQLTSR
jgi:NAD(P)-dependent dehydrogenase (short-subunit alcohol dehydrogenase family)